jgi:ABC-type nitrate/sulfonate/bicarbonate transport system permease component
MIIGGRTGIGAAILDLSERYELEEAYLYVVFVGVIGLLIDSASNRLAERLGAGHASGLTGSVS